MRKQRAAARGFPFEARPERVAVDRDQHEVALAGEPFARRLHRLFGGREMDETVLPVDRGAAISAGVLGLVPFGGGADLVDRRHRRIWSGPARFRKNGLRQTRKWFGPP